MMSVFIFSYLQHLTGLDTLRHVINGIGSLKLSWKKQVADGDLQT